ncbi:Fur family transcriptional regulator [Labilibaculum sp.]|uniref:Fur family transcriptional regulator n=1 Tax=Labilibaculum sp. TaxID=2060723 RepID=UPI0035645D6D
MISEHEISEKLALYNIRPSVARVKIYKYLIENRNHPNVETIYMAMLNTLTSISKTTVYNCLNLFVEKGIVTAIGIEDNELRFDVDISSHGHFKCVKCKGVFDFEFDVDSIQKSGLKDFVTTEYQLYIKGICRSCRTILELK